MSEEHYQKYFAIDEETGEYLARVTKPDRGRLAWLKQRLEEQSPKARKIREVKGLGQQAGGAGLIGFGASGL